MMAFHVSLVRDTCGEKRLKLFSGSPPFLQEEEKGALEEGGHAFQAMTVSLWGAMGGQPSRYSASLTDNGYPRRNRDFLRGG